MGRGGDCKSIRMEVHSGKEGKVKSDRRDEEKARKAGYKDARIVIQENGWSKREEDALDERTEAKAEQEERKRIGRCNEEIRGGVC